MSAREFDANFKALTGHDPFPWQRRLFGALFAGELPSGVDIPTGLGKTAVMAFRPTARSVDSRRVASKIALRNSMFNRRR